MCGIVGFVGKEKAVDFLIGGLEKLEYRGYDSAGIAVLSKKKFAVKKTTDRVADLKTKETEKLTGGLGIGHTRWATHGKPDLLNAHPHLSSNNKFAVVHNGIIENYQDLKRELEKDGYAFKSETDTEVIVHLLEKYYKTDIKEAVKKTIGRLKGSYALGILCSDLPDKLIAVKNFSPLIIGLSENAKVIASDITAIVPLTKKVVYLEDGQIAIIGREDVDFFDKNGNISNFKTTVINWDVESAQKGGYNHFMLKEIMEQPDAIEQTIRNRIKGDDIYFEEFCIDEEKLKSFEKIQIIGCGSAYHAGVVGKYVFEEMLRIPTEVDIASEFRYRNPVINEKTLTIAISQSGETADTLAAIKEAQKHGSHVMSIVNVVGSSIAKASNSVLYTWAGPEISVATTKGYSTQLAVIYLFAIWAAKRLKTATKEEINVLIKELIKLPKAIKEILICEETVKNIAEKYKDSSSVFYIGRNIDYAVSLEASLKLKEISYIHSEAYAAGELKHGTISLIEENRLVVALCGYERLFEKMLSNIKEVKARGAEVFSCTLEKNTQIEGESQINVYIPKTHNLFTASVEIIPFQLFAYYVACARNCDVDKPRNLAKSVTVE